MFVRILAAMTALILAGLGPAAAADDPDLIPIDEIVVSEPQIPQGVYEIHIQVSGSFTSEQGTWRGGGGGSGQMLVNADGGTGYWSYDGSGTFTTPDGPISAPGSIGDGTIFLDGGVIVLEGTGVSPAAEVLPAFVSCSMLSGGLVIELNSNASEAGFAPALRGRFLAMRTGDVEATGPAVITPRLEEALTDLDAFVAEVEGGSREDIVRQVQSLMDRVETAVGDLRSADACSRDSDFFASVAASHVARLITALTGEDDPATMAELAAVVSAGLRTGVLGPGSSNPDLERVLMTRVHDVGRFLLDEAMAAEPRDDDAIAEWLLLSDLMGWDDAVPDDLAAEVMGG